MITLTENAVKQIRSLQTQDDNAHKPLRIFIENGGCSGMQYGMAFDDKKADDQVVSTDGVEVIIDPMSADLMKNSVIDYADGLQGSGFQIKNPNAHSSCGCGRSFN